MTSSLAARLARAEALAAALTGTAPLPDAVALMQAAIGGAPDPWQRGVLESSAQRQLLLCCRQSGKSSTCACLALHTALAVPGSLILLLSPSLRQSQELFRKVQEAYRALGYVALLQAESALRFEMAQGSRIISLPGTESTIRGYSGVGLLVIDEAARVADELYYAVRPMLAVSGGRLIALSTPWGKRGWFHQEWSSSEGWERVKITADDCPRISKAFLTEERRSLPQLWYQSEYVFEFTDTIDQVFTFEDVQAALTPEVQPLFARHP
jgi:Terminase large subunit, T4likevirus-type, N-terminal